MGIFSFMQRVFILLLFIVLPVNAGVYKWTDEQGNVHYGDKPIDQDDSTELKINTNTDTGITNSSGNNKERDRMLQELQEDRDARKEIKAISALKERNGRKPACS